MFYPEAYTRFDGIINERKKQINSSKEAGYKEILSALYSIKNWEVVELKEGKLKKVEEVDFVSFLLKSGDNYFFYRAQVKSDASLSFNWHKDTPFTLKMDLYVGNRHYKYSQRVGSKICFTNTLFNRKIEAIEDIEMRTGILLKKMMPLLKQL